MRKKTKSIQIAVSEEVHKRLLKDKKHFQEIIGGGKWSISDTIGEYFKILPDNKGNR